MGNKQSLWAEVTALRAGGHLEAARQRLQSVIVEYQPSADLLDLCASVFDWNLIVQIFEPTPQKSLSLTQFVKLSYARSRTNYSSSIPMWITPVNDLSPDVESQLIFAATQLQNAWNDGDWAKATNCAANLLHLYELNRNRIFSFFPHIRSFVWMQIIPLIAISGDSPTISRLLEEVDSVGIVEEIVQHTRGIYRQLFRLGITDKENGDELRAVLPHLKVLLPDRLHELLTSFASASEHNRSDAATSIMSEYPGVKLMSLETAVPTAIISPPPFSRDPTNLTVSPLSGASSIGGSSHLIQIGDTHLLLDLGLDVNVPPQHAYRRLKESLDSILPGGLSQLYAILISHAHIDHIGLLPMLYRDPDLEWITSSAGQKPKLRLFASHATRELARQMLIDAAQIQKHTEREDFTEADANAIANLLELYPKEERLNRFIDRGTIKTFHAGHIVGSRMILIEHQGKSVLFSGDINTMQQATIDPVVYPDCPIDVLILEHTYGSETRSFTPLRKTQEVAFIQAMDRVLRRGGSLLIPAFAVGRAQEILCLLAEHAQTNLDLAYDIYLDGLAKEITRIYDENRSETTARYHAARLWLDRRLQVVDHNEHRLHVAAEAANRPSVIVASSGMLKKGSASYAYAESIGGDARNAIFITGYASEDSEAGMLLGRKDDALDALEFPVRCAVERFHFTAHAPREGLLSFVRHLQPQAIILVHGDSVRSLNDPDSVFNTLRSEGFQIYLGDETTSFRYGSGVLQPTIR